jgi:uncharacterized tellurite resistance protein B-like protein
MSDVPTPPEDLSLDKLASGEDTPERLQVAIISTLLQAAHAGGGLEPDELMRISSRIFSAFGLSDVQIGHLIQVAEVLRKDPERQKKCLQDIRNNFELNQRQEILSIVWRILIIDGKVDSNEAVVAVDIRKELDLSMEAAVAARISAERNEVDLLVKSLGKVDKDLGDDEEEDGE